MARNRDERNVKVSTPANTTSTTYATSRSMEIIDAELRLGPPGCGGGDAVIGVGAPAKKRRTEAVAVAVAEVEVEVESEASGTDAGMDAAAPASKVQVVGWPPVAGYRKSTFQAAAARGELPEGKIKGGMYVKVSMDGAPYLRKVDLRTYGGYRELRAALDALFGCFSSPADSAAHFAVAYEDKDGDLMLAGDVPWDMFISSCKKLRIMRGSEAR